MPNRTNQPIGKKHKRLRLACYFIKLNMDKIAACRYATREQAGGWIHFCMKRLRTLNSYQIFKIKNKKYKIYSG